MLDRFVNQHSELEMSRWLKVCLPAKEHICTHTLQQGIWEPICGIFWLTTIKSQVMLTIYAMKELVVLAKNTQKAKITVNIVQQMSFFLSWNTARTHNDSNPVQCDGFDVACWVCNMSLSSKSYNNYLLFGFLDPVCHVIGGHLSLFCHCLFNHGRPINFSRPCPLQGRSLPAARVSHCLDPFTSVVNE